ncbi:transposase [Sedimenticola sp.]|uniref:transposase n=1 Tax=Sedimenticola sp. TaxID=1940285 RepID=UPI003D0FADF4
MTNHIHFLVTPRQTVALSNMMKVVGSRYAQSMNLKYGRTGTVWESRHSIKLDTTGRLYADLLSVY